MEGVVGVSKDNILPHPFSLSHGTGANLGFASLNPLPRGVNALLDEMETSTLPLAGSAKLSPAAGGLSRFPCHHLYMT